MSDDPSYDEFGAPKGVSSLKSRFEQLANKQSGPTSPVGPPSKTGTGLFDLPEASAIKSGGEGAGGENKVSTSHGHGKVPPPLPTGKPKPTTLPSRTGGRSTFGKASGAAELLNREGGHAAEGSDGGLGVSTGTPKPSGLGMLFPPNIAVETRQRASSNPTPSTPKLDSGEHPPESSGWPSWNGVGRANGHERIGSKNSTKDTFHVPPPLKVVRASPSSPELAASTVLTSPGYFGGGAPSIPSSLRPGQHRQVSEASDVSELSPGSLGPSAANSRGSGTPASSRAPSPALTKPAPPIPAIKQGSSSSVQDISDSATSPTSSTKPSLAPSNMNRGPKGTTPEMTSPVRRPAPPPPPSGNTKATPQASPVPSLSDLPSKSNPQAPPPISTPPLGPSHAHSASGSGLSNLISMFDHQTSPDPSSTPSQVRPPVPPHPSHAHSQSLQLTSPTIQSPTSNASSLSPYMADLIALSSSPGTSGSHAHTLPMPPLRPASRTSVPSPTTGSTPPPPPPRPVSRASLPGMHSQPPLPRHHLSVSTGSSSTWAGLDDEDDRDPFAADDETPRLDVFADFNGDAQSPKPALPRRPSPSKPGSDPSVPLVSNFDMNSVPTRPPPLPARATSSPTARSKTLLPGVSETSGMQTSFSEGSPGLPPTSSPKQSPKRPPIPLPTRPGALPPRLPNRNASPTVNSVVSPVAGPSSASTGTWQAPPPPTRSIGLGAKLAPVRPVLKTSAGEEDDEGSSSSEGEEEEAALGGGQRKGDDLPDATFANRRPPCLRPDRVINAKAQHFLCYAIKGNAVCTGSSHVRVWSGDTGEKVQSMTLKGEHRIEKMQFRPGTAAASGLGLGVTGDYLRGGLDKSDEGRYLWCGTKDGLLVELDLKTNVPTDYKVNAHSAPIVSILRCWTSMITIDQTGKVCIFSPEPDPLDPESWLPPALSGKNVVTQRIADKQTFFGVFGTQLWTSSGPAASKGSSGTTAVGGSRGPTIRAYEPLSNGPFVATNRPLTLPDLNIYVGAVTSGTVLLREPNIAYLGHETGHVSIWDKTTYTCLTVKKISANYITALEGVTDYLWAGFRTGFVYVYDVREEPWKVIKAWKAHKDPVVDIVVDPVTLWTMSQLHVATVCANATIHFWDGLMRQDWQDQQMLLRQPDYCTFRTIRILICTWNVDATKPESLKQLSQNQNFLPTCLMQANGPEIVVFGFQELIDLESRKLTAKTVLLGKKKDAKFNDSVSHSYRLWHDELIREVRTAMPPNSPYSVVLVESMVGLFSCIFIKQSERAGLRDVAVASVKTGLGGRYGNKGGILCRFVIDDTSICFANCHLTAGQNHRQQRNRDLVEILEASKSRFSDLGVAGAYISGGDGTMVFDHELCFLSGDLNYRIDFRRDLVLKAIQEGDIATLLNHDQLLKEAKNNHGFRLRSFRESPITFLPTYKYDPGTDDYDSSEKRRVPAWCDRILWRADRPGKIHPVYYGRHEVNTSDHRPVSGTFETEIKSIVPERLAEAKRDVAFAWEGKEKEMLDSAREFYHAWV